MHSYTFAFGNIHGVYYNHCMLKENTTIARPGKQLSAGKICAYIVHKNHYFTITKVISIYRNKFMHTKFPSSCKFTARSCKPTSCVTRSCTPGSL